MKIEPINIIQMLIIWQSALFSIVLVTPKYIKKPSNKFLSFLLFTLFIHFIYNVLYTNGYYLDILPPYSCSYGYLYGPFLYLHVKFHLQKHAQFRAIDWLHFLPFTTIILITLLGNPICNIVGFWLLPTMFVYCIFGFIEIARYKKVIQQVSPNNLDSETNWLKMLLLVTIVIVLLDMFESQIRSLIIFEFELLIEPIVQVGILILVNIITYQGLKNPLFFQQITQNDLSVVNINKPHSSSALNKESLELLTIQLEAFMNLHKPYLNPDLDLNMLAEELESHPKKLSQAINQCIGNNFSDYINSRRIAEAKSLFETSTDSQITIMEVMYKVGFNSRSVFNTSFKKKIGFTPTQFKEQQFS